MPLTPEELAIMHDYDRASHNAIKYIVPFLVQMNMRGLMITSAMQKFAKFLDLPESNSGLAAVWDVAFATLSIAVPALRLAGVLQKAEMAVELSAQLGNTGAKVMKVAAKVPGAIDKTKTTISGYQDKLDKLHDPPEGMSELAKLDVSKKPLRDLLEDANRAVKLWDSVLDLIDDEKERRLSHPTVANKESMFDMTQRLLPALDSFSNDDLDSIELMYLWLMISSYAKKNVVIVTTDYGWGNQDVNISGLNNNQQSTLMALFGMGAKRSKYFNAPPAFGIYMLLTYWGVGSRTDMRIKDNIGNKI